MRGARRLGLYGGAAVSTPPTYVGESNIVSNSPYQDSISISIPTGYSEGDLLIIEAQTDDAETISTPSGWTKLDNVGNGNNVYVFYKIASSSESSVTVTASDDDIHGIMYCFSNNASSSPIDDYATDTDRAESLSLPTITTSVDNVMIVHIVGSTYTSDNWLSSWANSSLESITEAEDDENGGEAFFGMAYGVMASAGLINSTTVDATSDKNTVMFTIGILPA